MLKVSLKSFINRLKNTSVYKDFLNNVFLVGFFIVLLLVLLNNWIGIFIILPYAYYLYLNKKTLLYASLIISIVVGCNFYLLETQVENDLEPSFSGTVIDLSTSEYYQKITLKSGKYKNIIYDNDFHQLKVGDIIEGNGEILESEPARVKGGFDYQLYLKHNKVTKVIRSKAIYVRGKTFRLECIKALFLKSLERNFRGDSLVFLKAMIIGDDDGFSDAFRKAVTDNGILHLFAVSGLHIILFVEVINKILHFFKIKQNIIDLLVSVFLFLFLVLTGFAPSVIRAALMYYLKLINKLLKLGFSATDNIAVGFILLISINPYYMYSLGFILSFVASISIILVSPLIKNTNHFLSLFIITVVVTFWTLPIVINVNNEINLLSPITNIIFIDLIEGIILPISLIVFVFPFLKVFYSFIILVFSKFTIIVSKYLYVPLVIKDFTFFATIIYYILLLVLGASLCHRNRRRLFASLLLVFILIYSYSTSFKSYGEIDFLDLDNGEAILIREPYGNCNILIDTGDGTNNVLTSYLKSQGIRVLDYLILTHNHNDHNGEAELIMKEINVKNLVISAYDNSEISKNMNSIKVRANDIIECGNLRLNILHPDRFYEDENDNSIVIYVEIGGKRFLFLGDVSQTIEEKLSRLSLKVDVLKVGHHGSSTSTNPGFIAHIVPEYAIIQTGRVEKFGFPHLQTIETLDLYNVKTYRTDLNYSITYRYKKKEGIFITLK